MTALAARLERAGRWLARWSLLAGAIVLAVMLGLTLVDVAGRYLLNAPVNGKTELTRIMMAILITCALPVVTLSGEQITVDLLDRYVRGRLAVVRNLLVDLVAVGLLAVLADWLVFRADRLLKRGNVSDFLAIPLYPVGYFVAAMMALTALALAIKIAVDLIRLSAPAAPDRGA